MKILITGSQGYIAKNLAKKLSKNFFCYGIGRGNWKRSDFKKWGYIKNISGNINNKSLKKFKDFKFDYVVHLAGGLSPNASILKSEAKIKDFEKNVLSTRNILRYLITKNIKSKFIFLSSISVFGNNKLKKLEENSKTSPISTYAKNKLKAEKLCSDYNKKFNIDVLILRGTSIFGPGLNRQIIHDVCEKIQSNKNVFFGSGEEERDFLYINDMCDFIQKVIKKGFTGLEIINVGTGKGTKIKKIIRYINYKLGGKLKPKFNKQGHDINPNRLIPNMKKTLKYKWKPKVSLYKGIDNYIKWFLRKNKND